MCGIFGVILKDKTSWSVNDFHHDMEQLCMLSERRGKDATGLVVHAGDDVSILRRGGNARQMIQDPRFSRAIQEGFKLSGSALGVMGHCRLVTNGSMGLEDNNQPIVAGPLIGIHNGIVTNADRLIPGEGPDVSAENRATVESVWAESDTKALFTRMTQHLGESGNLQHAAAETFNEIIGSASIAVFQPEKQTLLLASNTGSLFYLYSEKSGVLIFASEKMILEHFNAKSRLVPKLEGPVLHQLKAQHGLSTDFALSHFKVFDMVTARQSPPTPSSEPSHKYQVKALRSDVKNLKRCTKCILPHTYPLITFDGMGICNYCHRHAKQVTHGEKALEQFLSKFRSKDGSPDCLVGLSGGRDSCYGIHLLKTKYGMNPIAYTFDWGLTTDTSRRNQAKVCGKLGIEHILRAPDIQKKRGYVRKNVHAFLKSPHMGMVPLFMAGDKDFYHFGRQLRDENKLPLTVFCSGHTLEQRDFMTGFCGVDEDISNNKRLYKFSTANKIKLAAFYSFQYLKNPAYINASLADSVRAFLYSFVSRDDFLYLFEYLPWNEAVIEKLLNEEYNWEADKKYGKNQWRMGDGQTAFTNYIYYTVAGFSEFDNFRANQIREGMLNRDEALRLVAHDNEPKWDTLNYFSHVIGINLDEVLRDINNIPKLY